MIFDYKMKARYYDLSIDDYREGEVEYFKHLMSINFPKNSPILKYFGNSFFHDYLTMQINFKPNSKELELFLSSDNILEDINDYRTSKKLSKISHKSFWANPIIIECEFKGVSGYRCNADFDNYRDIMDTEISSYDKKKGYQICITFSEKDEISFYCKGLRVKTSGLLVRAYTEGRLSSIPFCENCQSKWLTIEALEANT